MEDFIDSLEDEEQREVLARAIRGKGAFGRFHSVIHAYKIQDNWYQYQRDRLKDMAIEWCKDNGLAYKV